MLILKDTVKRASLVTPQKAGSHSVGIGTDGGTPLGTVRTGVVYVVQRVEQRAASLNRFNIKKEDHVSIRKRKDFTRKIFHNMVRFFFLVIEHHF